jgi:hypothetical protein
MTGGSCAGVEVALGSIELDGGDPAGVSLEVRSVADVAGDLGLFSAARKE